MQPRDWVLRRNCSVTPRQLAAAYGAICAASGVVAVGFTLRGAWYVLAFAMVELAAVGVAFLVFARHAADRERIALDEQVLLVEVVEADRVSSVTLDPGVASVELTAGRNALIRIHGGGDSIEVGRFVPEWKRRQFARELKLALSHAPPETEG